MFEGLDVEIEGGAQPGRVDEVEAAPRTTSGFVPSHYQQAIFDWIVNGKGHAVVDAVAGSGKTTTLIKALEHTAGKRVLLVAFNRHIAQELKARVPPHVQARTLHSFGTAVCYRTLGSDIEITPDKTRMILEETLREAYSEASVHYLMRFILGPVAKLVSLMKSYGHWCDITSLADTYEIDLPDTVPHEQLARICEAVWHRSINDLRRLDFDDQILFPVLHDLPIPRFHFVFVDEAQDLNPIQVQMASRMVGRLVAVGDKHQAVYGFRGAGINTIDYIQRAFDATMLPLSICYRCPTKVVQAAQEVVPHIEPRSDAEPGVIARVDNLEQARDGDFILCRVTAPLVSNCLRMIQQGRKAFIRGRDIGENLDKMIDRVGGDDITRFLHNLDAYEQRQVAYLQSRDRQNQIIDLQDQCQTLRVLGQAARTVQQVKERIERIFKDTRTTGILFSTVHRAKGLEADRVFILRPELMPHPAATQSWMKQQERNIRYVAVTRTRRELYWVKGSERDLNMGPVPRASSDHLQGREDWELLVMKIDEMLESGNYQWADQTLEGIRNTVLRRESASAGQKRAIHNILNSRRRR